ncbi:hypothetical protein [Streptomyces sp. NPDC008141]|uniref:hypothetical protein n=1 Tax=Streptomyces sp. NPDC008141 TaxID=3364815 RepID=UPI0036EF1554
MQGLTDIRLSLVTGAVTYWVDEALQVTDNQDLDKTPDSVKETTHALAVMAVHLGDEPAADEILRKFEDAETKLSDEERTRHDG